MSESIPGEEETVSDPENNTVNGEVSYNSEDEDEGGHPEEVEVGVGYMLLPSTSDDEDNHLESHPTHILAQSDSISNDHGSMSLNEPPMEASQAQAIKQAMSGFSLNVTPNWAQNLSEDVWKQELLEGIRKQTQND